MYILGRLNKLLTVPKLSTLLWSCLQWHVTWKRAFERTTDVGIPYMKGTMDKIKRVINSCGITHRSSQYESSRKSYASLDIDWNGKKSVAPFARSCVEGEEMRNVMKTLEKRKDHSRHVH